MFVMAPLFPPAVRFPDVHRVVGCRLLHGHVRLPHESRQIVSAERPGHASGEALGGGRRRRRDAPTAGAAAAVRAGGTA